MTIETKTEYYPNGQLRYEDNWKDGKKHGLCKGWDENGTIMYEYNYKDGELHGLSKGWYENGQVMYEDNYKNGEPIEEINHEKR